MSTSPEWAFNFERALATWRQFVSRNPAIRDADLDELEAHLRDAYEGFLSQGMEEEKAFEAAKDDLGDLALLQTSYGKVHREKLFRPETRSDEWAAAWATVGNYMKSAWRNASRQKGITMLNVTGLSLALAASLLIGLFIQHSFSYDRFHENADRILRFEKDMGSWGQVARAPAGFADLLREEWSGVEKVTQVSGIRQTQSQFTVGDIQQLESDVLVVDGSFFDVFSYDILESSLNHPLSRPDALVLTESTARRWFGPEDPLGKTVDFETRRSLTVTAVIKDPPSASHLPFDILVRGFNEPRSLSWNTLGPFTYLILRDGAAPEDLISFIARRHAEDNPGAVADFHLRPLTEIHLQSEVTDSYSAGGDVRYLLLFALIGMFILLLAGINYVNLAIAQANRRNREIGVRKVIGASSSNLKGQFLLESVLIILLSLPVSVVLVVLTLPHIERISGVALPTSILLAPQTWLIILVGGLLVAVIAGFYPAVIMSRKQPVHIFQGARSSGKSRQRLRKALVGAQVGISFSLIVMTLLVSGQMHLISESNLGFDEEQVVSISPRNWSVDMFNRFKQDAEEHVAVESVAMGLPLGVGWKYFAWTERPDGFDEDVELEVIPAGVGFVETMGMKIVDGRPFREEDLGLDPAPLLVSESWARTFQDGEPVVGKVVREQFGPIVGVVKDIQNISLNDSDGITLFQLERDRVPGIVVRMAGANIPEALDVLNDAWSDVSPERAFVYRFLDEHIQSQYVVEQRLQRFFSLFAGLSVVIAAMGIFGLTALTTRQRDKEIAIRKSLGASESSILLLLNREFLTVVGLGILAATPFVWVYGNEWLQAFSRRVPFDGTQFLTAAFICVAFVVLSVSIQSLRAARANPVDALKWD